jgi:hypothetical protein
MSDWWNQPIQPSAQPDEAEAPARTCPWCGVAATPEAVYCAGCGASLAQREDLDGLAIPGVTTVDPALLPKGAGFTIARQNGRATAIGMGSMVGGIAGAAGVAAAMLAAEHLSNRQGAQTRPEDLGKPSEAAAAFAARLAEAERKLAQPAPQPPAEPAAAEPAPDGPETADPAGSNEPIDWAI